MLPFLSNTPEIRASPGSGVPSMEPSEYEYGMQLNSTTFSGSLFELSIQHDPEKKAFLALSSNQILEVVQNSSSTPTYYIHGVHQLHSLAKIQFRRGVSISFQFKSGLTKCYRMTDAVACCEYLKKQMKSAGLQAQHSSPDIEQQVITGCELLETVYQLEERFSVDPSFALLEAMMTLMRQAVECLGEAQDSRYQSALHRMRSFLMRADVVQILDEKRQKRSTAPPPEEVLELGLEQNTLSQKAGKRQLTDEDEGHTNDDNDQHQSEDVVGGDDDEDARLEKELYDLIGSLNEELKTLV